MAKNIKVVAGPKCGPGQVGLWERDEAHPDGEIYVYEGGPAVEAARTGAVSQALARGMLAEADGDEPKGEAKK